MVTACWLGISILVALATSDDSVTAEFPCSAKVPSLQGTRLYKELCHRQKLVSGEEHKPGVDCIVHVQTDDYEEVKTHASTFPDFPCTLEKKPKSEMRETMYNMFSNQLALDVAELPHAIAFPGTDDQIAALVQLGAHLRRKVYVVGGGHGAEAFAHAKGLVISMLNRRDMKVIKNAKSMGWDGPAIHLGCGVVWAETYAMAYASKTFMCGGSCGTVGACGFYMGGGFGYLSGQLGFAADNVLKMNVITAHGHKMEIDADHHADLFNSIRGGGHAGLAIVSDVTYKLHPRSKFGCIYKINLVYKKSPEEMDDHTWALKLANVAEYSDGKQLNVKLRWQCDEGHGVGFKFKITLLLLANPDIDTREGAAKFLTDILKKVRAPFPEGEMCGEHNWMRCLLGTPEKPTGFANCDKGDSDMGLHFSEDTGEIMDPNSEGGYDDEWGIKSNWQGMASNKGAVNGSSLYTLGHQHRTTLKSLLLKDINKDIFSAGRKSICDKKAGSTYIAVIWWGNGKWNTPGKGSVADVHKPFKYLVIMSSDYHDEHDDMGNVKWSSRTLHAFASAAAQEVLFYPNLYDRLYHHKETLPPFKETILIEANPNFVYGEKTDMVMAAKKKWDPNNLFDVRFRNDREIPGHLKDMLPSAKYEMQSQIMAHSLPLGPAVLMSVAAMAMVLAAVVAARFRCFIASRQQTTSDHALLSSDQATAE